MITHFGRPLIILLVLLLAAMTAPSTPALRVASNETGPAQQTMPDSLMAAFLEASSQAFARGADGYRAHSGGLDVTLDPTGLQANVSGIAWRLALRSLGREEETALLPDAEIVQADGQLEYHRDTLTEWYRHTGLGVEQGFTIHEPPGGKGPLVLRLDLATDLVGTADTDERGLSFTAPDGQTLRYDHLRAWDASGAPVEARLGYTPGQVTVQVDDRGATYPVTIDPLVYSEQRILASNGMAGDRVAYSVALWGDTALVGAPYSDVDGDIDRGSVYVFVRSGTTWNQQARLVASDGEAYDSLGSSVALWEDTALVGAPSDDIGTNSDQGSAYVFARSETTWTEEAHLTASDGARDDLFGHSVALSGGTALVGAYLDDIGSYSAQQGSAYVFIWNGTTWSEQAHLVASDGVALDRFGYSVALWGDTAAVGAFYHTVGENLEQGSLYIFTRSGAVWNEEAHIAASDGAAYDHFGNSVALWDDTALVGASDDDLGAGWGQGSAYIFVRNGTTWSEQAHLTASDGAVPDSFGNSVALWGDTAIVGAHWDLISGHSQPQGSVYVFVRNEATWSEQAHLIASDGESYDEFGGSVALWDDTALVGAASNDSAYVYARSETTWDEQQQLAAPSGWYDNLGSSVALWGNTALVGACSDDVGDNVDQGSAYVFVWNGRAWSEQGQLTASEGVAGDQFGYSVSLWGDTALVGAPYHSVDAGFSQGSAYIFTREGTKWTQQQELTASDGAAGDQFGYSVSLWGDTALVGAFAHDVAASTDQGSAYVFTRSGTTWSEQQILTASNGGEYDLLGRSVALWGDTALVAAPYSDLGTNYDQGSAYIFTRSGSTWSEQAQLAASDGTWSDQFGSAVALWGDTALVGARIDTVGENVWQGSAYLFTRSDATWSEQARLTDGEGETGDYYGASVAVWADTALVGTPGDDSADIYTRNGTTWSKEAHLTAWAGGYDDGYGTSVALWGSTALVGAPGCDIGATDDQGSAYVYDALPVITSISRGGPNPTHAPMVDFGVTYSEDVTGVDVSDFALTTDGSINGAVVVSVNGTGATYTVTASTGTGNGTLRLDSPSGATVTDLTGNPLSDLPYTTGETYTVDALPLVTSITRAGPSPTNAPSVSFAVTFSEDVIGVDVSDFVPSTSDPVIDAAVVAVVGSGATYTVAVSTGTGSGTLSLSLPISATITDLSGNSLSGLPYAASASYMVDKAAPIVLSISRTDPSPTYASTVGFAVTFSEDVTSVDVSDFVPSTVGSINGTVVTAIAGSGATYTVTVYSGTGTGTLGLDIPTTATITDLAGNLLSGLPYNGETYTVDVPPQITSISRVGSTPTSAASVGFAVTFSEDVTSVDVSDFSPSTTGSISDALVTAMTGFGATYTVTVSTGTGSGTLRLDVPASATITDLAGNPLTGLPYTNGEVYTIRYPVYLPLVLRTVP